ncbi:hypothetical protein, partial [Pantoea agglomerans]|uniref:hypothetical protein n=1 Tax=Enterobacter agglomerans TaxID=549 RepID=UPI001CA3B9DF
QNVKKVPHLMMFNNLVTLWINRAFTPLFQRNRFANHGAALFREAVTVHTSPDKAGYVHEATIIGL